MSKKKKPTMDEILGISKVKARRVSGGSIKHQGEDKPKVTVELMEGSNEGETVNYGFLTPKAVENLEDSAEYDGENIVLLVPEPKNIDEDGINWVVS
jgi:hypothetical protein